MKYVLGLDFGGGACKATLLRSDGNIVATATAEYQTIATSDGGREQNPRDWFSATVKNIKEVLKKAKVSGSDVEGLCFDAATHTAVLLDDGFNVLRNSVYWTDTRSAKQKEYLEKNYGVDIFQRFKHKVDTVWTLTELLWIKENEPELWKKVRKITFAKDYVRHLFTGDFVTDYIEAEGSMLFDFDKQEWSKKYLDLLELTDKQLPQIVKPQTVVGGICCETAKLCGLKENIKVICGTTDTAMEVFASGAVEKGLATVKLATAGRICVVHDSIIPDKHIINYSHIQEGLFYPGTATKSCAASLRWLRDTFGGEYKQMDAAAEKINMGADGLFFHPYLSGELTPYGNAELRGSFTGISSTHTKAHFIRSVLEGVAFSLLDCKIYLEKKGIILKQAFIIGGGANSNLWRQIVADVLGINLICTENNDSSFGSAMLAGVAVGFFESGKQAVKICSKINGQTVPDKENNKKYCMMFKKYKAIQKALENIYNA